MRGKIKNSLVFGLVTLLPVVCFATCITSTLAWYQYNTRTTVIYEGTSVMANKQLQIGIETDVDLTEYGLTTVDGIAWAVPGSTLTTDCISYYLEQSGHASTELFPVTSRCYEENDSLTLYKSITDEIHCNPEHAEDIMYVYVPLTFRVIELSTNTPVPNREVWLTETTLVGSNYNVQKGVRVHFDNSSSKYIYNPSELVNAGKTAMAGPLDLNKDGYYDVDHDNYEIIYGDVLSGTPTYDKQIGDSDYDDINKTGETTGTTFYAKHKDGNYRINNFDDLNIAYAEYESKNSIAPDYNSGTGHFSGGKPVCITSNDEAAIGKVNMTIWLEGWDHVIVDRVVGLDFNLSLTFQCNHV